MEKMAEHDQKMLRRRSRRELKSLARHCGSGDWSWGEMENPLLKLDQSFLDVLCFHKESQPVLEMTLERLEQQPEIERRALQYRIAEELDVKHYSIEDQIRYAMSVNLNMKYIALFKRQWGEDFYVIIRPHPECCLVCRRLYSMDNNTPKHFKLSDLAPTGSNVGKALPDWRPTVPPLHFDCRCIIHHFDPDLQSFNDSGEIIFKSAKNSDRMAIVKPSVLPPFSEPVSETGQGEGSDRGPWSSQLKVIGRIMRFFRGHK